MKTKLSDEELIARVKHRCGAKAVLLADLLVDLIEIEERRMHVRSACSSMQEFCKRHLGMPPNQAWRRSMAARLVRRVPVLLDYVRRGEVDLSTLMLLRHYIDEENADELIRATRNKPKRQIERLLESREPRAGRRTRATSRSRKAANELLERLEEISDELYALEAAIANETRILIERARHLLKDSKPDAKLADLIHRAFAALVESLESRAKARSKRVPSPPLAKAGRVSRADEYTVFVRDGFQCTFTSAQGVRCRATTHLQVDHIFPRAKGGSNELHNLRCVCQAHNHHYAELAFGKTFIQSRIRKRQNRARVRLRAAGAFG